MVDARGDSSGAIRGVTSARIKWPNFALLVLSGSRADSCGVFRGLVYIKQPCGETAKPNPLRRPDR